MPNVVEKMPKNNELIVDIEDISPVFGPTAGWENFGGICGDVTLLYSSALYIENVFFCSTSCFRIRRSTIYCPICTLPRKYRYLRRRKAVLSFLTRYHFLSVFIISKKLLIVNKKTNKKQKFTIFSQKFILQKLQGFGIIVLLQETCIKNRRKYYVFLYRPYSSRLR